jgi:hypothetical protein
MITEISFGKDKYHLQEPMQDWLKQNIGPGHWTSGTPASWEWIAHKDSVWCISCIFGNTTFAFKNPIDATAFTLRWI